MPPNRRAYSAAAFRASACFAFGLALATQGLAAEPGNEGWGPASSSGGLTIFSRPRKDSALKEFKAVGVIEAEPIVVRRVLEDVPEFPHFMPHITEARLISQKSDVRISYQRVSGPLIGDRDYTIRIQWETKRLTDGAFSYRNQWQSANDLGPAEKPGVTRAKVNEGHWVLEPVGPRQTRATYRIFFDGGVSLPAMLLNSGNKSSIPKLFEAIRKQAKLEKYSRAE